MDRECEMCFGTGKLVSGGEIFEENCPQCEGLGWLDADALARLEREAEEEKRLNEIVRDRRERHSKE